MTEWLFFAFLVWVVCELIFSEDIQ